MRALSFLALCLLSTSALASDVGYEVEIILFEDVSGVFDHTEHWAAEAALVDKQAPDALIKVDPREARADDYTLLKPDQYRLSRQAEKLEKHPDYRVLVHSAWKQKGLDKDQVFALPLDSRTTPAPEDAGTAAADYVTGNITLIMSRYLHVQSKLQLVRPNQALPVPVSQPAEGEFPVAQPLQTQTYTINFERRMRSREVHYLDHPLVGLIVLATPFKIEPEKQPGTQPPNYKTL